MRNEVNEKVTYAKATFGDDFDQIDQGHPAKIHHLNVSDLKGGQQVDESYDFQIKRERDKLEKQKKIETYNAQALESAMKNQF